MTLKFYQLEPFFIIKKIEIQRICRIKINKNSNILQSTKKLIYKYKRFNLKFFKHLLIPASKKVAN